MLLRQLRYFLTVVDENSFTEAAEKLFISQSAISQQIKALEASLGVSLLLREKRSFTLTPAGEYLYRRGKSLVDEADAISRETVRIGSGASAQLRIGYLNLFNGQALHQAIAIFSARYPHVHITISGGTHEELYHGLLDRSLDIALNDQRRAFSDEYINLELAQPPVLAEISVRHPLASRAQVELADLHVLPCILLSPKSQQEMEREYYEKILGFPGEFLFASSLEAARLMVTGGQGYLPIEDIGALPPVHTGVRRIPVLRHGTPLRRRYCAFWPKDWENEFVAVFADILRQQIAAPEP